MSKAAKRRGALPRLRSSSKPPIVEADIMASSDPLPIQEDLTGDQTIALERETQRLREMEEKLRANETKFSAAFHALPWAFLISRFEDGRILEANEGFRKMFGYGTEELWELSLSDLNLWFDPSTGDNILNKVSLLGAVYNTEVLLRHKSGRAFWTLFSMESLTLKDERCLLIMITDIDQQKRTSRNVQESEERFRTLFENAPDAYYLIDPAGNFLDGNTTAEELTGYRKEELIGRSFFSSHLVTDEQLPTLTELLKLSASGLATGPDEVVLTRKDGSQVVVEIITRPITFRNQRLILGLARDVTERKRILKERENLFQDVLNSEQRLRWALQAGHGGAWDLDLVNDESWLSPEMYDLLGVLPGPRMNTERSMAVILPEGRQKFQQLIDQALASHVELDYEYRLVRPDGAERWMKTAGRIIPNPSGRAARVIGITLDITDRKKSEQLLERGRDLLEEEIRERTKDLERSRRAALSLMQDANSQRQRAEKALEDLAKLEQALTVAKEEAEGANKAKSSFLAMISHEIRTPMNAVVSLAYLISKTVLTPKQREYLNKMLNASYALQKIVEDTLDFSKIEAGHMELEDIEFSLDSLHEQLMSILMVKAQRKGLRLSFNKEPDVPIGLLGDPLRLSQVLLNLTDNAIKFTESGRVTISVRLESKEENHVVLRFSIVDTGIGITETQSSRLFQPFIQADGSTTRKFGGTGLGLAITKRLVEMMGGQVCVRSKPGQGSEFAFTVRLGLAASSHAFPVPVESGRPAAMGSLVGARVLLVEDDEVNREVGRELLESEGLVVDAVENGKRAVKKAKPDRYDIILMDIKMPVMDGIEATQAIRLNPLLKDLPILAMTADVMAEDIEVFRRIGINDNISKPIDPIKLFEVLAKWIRPSLGREGPKGFSLQKANPPFQALIELGDLPGIDIEQGLSRVSGKVGLYRKLLQKFRDRNMDIAHRIQEALDKNSYFLAKRLTHNLKGVSGNIGAREIYQASSDLNQALKSGEYDRAKGMLADLSGRLDEVMDSIARCGGEVESPPAKRRVSDFKSLEQLLPRMVRLIEASDLEALDLLPEIITAFRGTDFEQKAKGFEEALEELQFEDALAILKEIVKEYRIESGGNDG